MTSDPGENPSAVPQVPALAPDGSGAFVDSRFRARHIQNWAVLGLLYALFYMSRYNYSATSALPRWSARLEEWPLGVFETMMPLVYGLTVVLNGPLADRFGGTHGVPLRRRRRDRHELRLRLRPPQRDRRSHRAGVAPGPRHNLGRERLLPVVRGAQHRQGQRTLVQCAGNEARSRESSECSSASG